LKTRLKQWIVWLKCTAKILLKKRLDFPLEREIETMDRLPKIQGKKMLKQRLNFAFQNSIETMDSFVKMHGQNIVETTVRFSI